MSVANLKSLLKENFIRTLKKFLLSSAPYRGAQEGRNFFTVLFIDISKVNEKAELIRLCAEIKAKQAQKGTR